MKINDNGIDREMSDTERAQYEAWLATEQQNQIAKIEIAEAQALAKMSARSKLKALGLTDDEINALVG